MGTPLRAAASAPATPVQLRGRFLWSAAEALLTHSPPLAASLGVVCRELCEKNIVEPPRAAVEGSCKRCEAPLLPGVSCSVRLIKRKGQDKSRHLKTEHEKQVRRVNDISYKCNFCGEKNLREGTPKFHVKTKISQEAARVAMKSISKEQSDAATATQVAKSGNIISGKKFGRPQSPPIFTQGTPGEPISDLKLSGFSNNNSPFPSYFSGRRGVHIEKGGMQDTPIYTPMPFTIGDSEAAVSRSGDVPGSLDDAIGSSNAVILTNSKENGSDVLKDGSPPLRQQLEERLEAAAAEGSAKCLDSALSPRESEDNVVPGLQQGSNGNLMLTLPSANGGEGGSKSEASLDAWVVDSGKKEKENVVMHTPMNSAHGVEVGAKDQESGSVTKPDNATDAATLDDKSGNGCYSEKGKPTEASHSEDMDVKGATDHKIAEVVKGKISKSAGVTTPRRAGVLTRTQRAKLMEQSSDEEDFSVLPGLPRSARKSTRARPPVKSVRGTPLAVLNEEDLKKTPTGSTKQSTQEGRKTPAMTSAMNINEPAESKPKDVDEAEQKSEHVGSQDEMIGEVGEQRENEMQGRLAMSMDNGPPFLTEKVTCMDTSFGIGENQETGADNLNIHRGEEVHDHTKAAMASVQDIVKVVEDLNDTEQNVRTREDGHEEESGRNSGPSPPAIQVTLPEVRDVATNCFESPEEVQRSPSPGKSALKNGLENAGEGSVDVDMRNSERVALEDAAEVMKHVVKLPSTILLYEEASPKVEGADNMEENGDNGDNGDREARADDARTPFRSSSRTDIAVSSQGDAWNRERDFTSEDANYRGIQQEENVDGEDNLKESDAGKEVVVPHSNIPKEEDAEGEAGLPRKSDESRSIHEELAERKEAEQVDSFNGTLASSRVAQVSAGVVGKLQEGEESVGGRANGDYEALVESTSLQARSWSSAHPKEREVVELRNALDQQLAKNAEMKRKLLAVRRRGKRQRQHLEEQLGKAARCIAMARVHLSLSIRMRQLQNRPQTIQGKESENQQLRSFASSGLLAKGGDAVKEGAVAGGELVERKDISTTGSHGNKKREREVSNGLDLVASKRAMRRLPERAENHVVKAAIGDKHKHWVRSRPQSVRTQWQKIGRRWRIMEVPSCSHSG